MRGAWGAARRCGRTSNPKLLQRDALVELELGKGQVVDLQRAVEAKNARGRARQRRYSRSTAPPAHRHARTMTMAGPDLDYTWLHIHDAAVAGGAARLVQRRDAAASRMRRAAASRGVHVPGRVGCEYGVRRAQRRSRGVRRRRDGARARARRDLRQHVWRRGAPPYSRRRVAPERRGAATGHLRSWGASRKRATAGTATASQRNNAR